mgnify:CR=1 FL=1
MRFKDKLTKMKACSDAVAWVGNRSLKKAWAECEYADWMMWLCGEMADRPGWSTHQELVLVACWGARGAQKYWTDESDTRPMDAIKAAKRWAKNPSDKNEAAAWAAGDAVWGAAWGAALDTERAAAWAAEGAASAAARAAWAAGAAAWAAGAAGAAAWAAGAAARAAQNKKMCDHIRKTLKIGRI